MSDWKALSPSRKEKLNHGAMMMVAKNARKRGLLNFEQDKRFCPKLASFTVDVGGGVTGTVTLTPTPNDPKLLHVMLEFEDVYIQSHIYKIGPMFTSWRHFRIHSSGGVPDAIVLLAEHPITMDEVFA